VAILAVMHGPARHQLAVEVDHDAQVQLSSSLDTSVMSVSHLVSSWLAQKSRSSRFPTPTGQMPCLLPKRRLRRRGKPCSPALAIKRATRLRPALARARGLGVRNAQA
jgi:hypothetical protein